MPETMPAGRELDALIDERVMQRRIDPTRCPVCGWPLRLDVTLGCVPGNCAMRPAPAVRYDAVPHYSADIAAAWTIMEKLRADRWYVRVDDEANGSDWCATVGGFTPVYAPTAPLAVCLAALAAFEKAPSAPTPTEP